MSIGMRTIVKTGTIAGVTALGIGLAGPAFAGTTAPAPTPAHPTSTATPTIGTKLTVTVQQGRPGQQVRVRAVAKSGVFERGTAQSFAFTGDVSLDSGDSEGAGAIGIAVLKSSIKPGTYKVTVTGGKDAYGIGWLQVLPAKGHDNGGKQTTVIPKGGAKTGGGGASATGDDLPLIAGGAAIALLGAGGATIAIRRRRSTAMTNAAA
jgi:hypothetical protein